MSGREPFVKFIPIEIALPGPRLMVFGQESSDEAVADSALGKIRITHSRRRISSFKRSCMLVVRSRRRYFSGSTITLTASSKRSSRQATALGAIVSKRATKTANCRRASARRRFTAV